MTIPCHYSEILHRGLEQHTDSLKEKFYIMLNNSLVLTDEKVMPGHFDQLLSFCPLSDSGIDTVGQERKHEKSFW